jgi:D-arabinose 1-dehydrogenase-like Zn-dependent alcohol dehydrogenase
MIKLCAEKNINPIVEEYDFDDLPKAFDKLENGKPHFRCVVNAKNYAEKHGLKK